MRDIPVVIKADVSSVEDTWDITKKPGDDQELSESGSGQNITVNPDVEKSKESNMFGETPKNGMLVAKGWRRIVMLRPSRPAFGGYGIHSEEERKEAEEVSRYAKIQILDVPVFKRCNEEEPNLDSKG